MVGYPILVGLSGARAKTEQQPVQYARFLRRHLVHADHPVGAIALAIAATNAGVIDEHFAIRAAVDGVRRTVGHAMRMLAVTATGRDVKMRVGAPRLAVEA